MVETPRKKPRKEAVLSRHPLFPAIVALWFGALFGLGSLALRPALVEQFVIAAGIDTLIPATAPPLGPTTRILIALAMTGLGALLGGSLARRIARPAPEVRQRRRGAPSSASETIAPRALSRDDYFGAGAGLDANRGGDDLSLQANKRRSLALPDDTGPLEIHETAPLPGTQHDRAPVAPLDLAAWDVPPEPARQGSHLDEPARLGQTANTGVGTGIGDQLKDDNEDAMFVQAATPAEPLDLADLPDAGHRPFAPAPFAPSSFSPPSFAVPPLAGPGPAAEARPFAVPSDAIWFDPKVPEAEAGEPEAAALPQDTAPELPSDDPVETQAAEPVAETAPANPPANESRAKPALIPPVGAAAERLVAADFDELSPVQLVERLAISLQRRRQAVAAEAVPAVLNPAPGTDFAQPAVAPLQRLVQPAIGAPVQPPAVAAGAPLAPLAMPAALRPLDFEAQADEDEDLDEAALDFLPPRQFSWQAQPAAEPLFGKPAAETRIDEEPEHLPDTAEDVDLEESYSSLLDLSRPGTQRASFIRIEDGDDDDGMVEPVVVFPGQRTPLATPVAGSPAASQAAAAPAPGSPASSAARLFDRPSDSSAMPARSVDQEEADRALRAALATLQRMSGAA